MTPTDEFFYELPEHSIAQEAIEPRDSARLLDAHSLFDGTMLDLPSLLRPGDLLVVNNTKVRAARLRGHKSDTGGVVEVLLVAKRSDGDWDALCRPSRRVRQGQNLDFGRIEGVVQTAPADGLVRLSLRSAHGNVEDLLPEVGSVPLPPYFRGSLDDSDRYQTMFARPVGSAAAPTAGLHFTPRLIRALAAHEVEIAEVELQVGLDTFRPISSVDIEGHAMHREQYSVSEESAARIAVAKSSQRRVIAVGTTVVRTLESAGRGGMVEAGRGDTGLFIKPGYRFAIADGMVTNFHAPRTSLIVLIAAALGSAWRDAYKTALARRFRFLSFGDAMFITGIPKQ